MDQVLLAIKHQDRDRLLSLVHWEGVDEEFRTTHWGILCDSLLGDQYRETYIEEAPADDALLVLNGEELVWTSPPTRRIVLRHVKTQPDQEMTTHLSAAQIDGIWYIVGRRRRAPGEALAAVAIDEYKGPAANPRPGGGREKYNAIDSGMPRDQVFMILGNVLVHKLEQTGGSQEAYEWEYRGGNISVGFSDGVAQWKSNTFVNN